MHPSLLMHVCNTPCMPSQRSPSARSGEVPFRYEATQGLLLSRPPTSQSTSLTSPTQPNYASPNSHISQKQQSTRFAHTSNYDSKERRSARNVEDDDVASVASAVTAMSSSSRATSTLSISRGVSIAQSMSAQTSPHSTHGAAHSLHGAAHCTHSRSDALREQEVVSGQHACMHTNLHACLHLLQSWVLHATARASTPAQVLGQSLHILMFDCVPSPCMTKAGVEHACWIHQVRDLHELMCTAVKTACR